ncbi:alpha/beta fold hydrolase [Bacillus sp. 03113]|uniref:alpha/beta fold hydrolase n=1 Tax=Bacillus sp. 03113 TaxID=2578211 RepID=UPI00215CDEAB|nr:alpha/beta hydrolase [Bacillus sp. 03113]
MDVNLHYHEFGKGETIVLLHGFCGSTDYWKELVPYFQEKFHIITIDLRGHGQSDIPSAPFLIEDMAEDVYSFLVHKGINQVYLFGHSLGGYVTLAFAEKYPEKLKGYGLIHSTAYPDTKEGKEGRSKAIEKIAAEGIHSFIDGLIPKLFDDESLEKMPEVVQEMKEIGYATSPLGAADTLKAMRERKDRNDVLANENIPVLIVKGEKDKVVPADRVNSVSGSHISEQTIKMAGHMSMLEAPKELKEVIESFISKHC